MQVICSFPSCAPDYVYGRSGRSLLVESIDSMIRKSKKYWGRQTYSSGPTLWDCGSYNVIIVLFRINLDLLRNPNDAIRIVKEFQSKEGAKLVARYASLFIACMCFIVSFLPRFFQNLGDISLALQFLILSGCQEDAFQIAEVSAIIVEIYCISSKSRCGKIWFQGAVQCSDNLRATGFRRRCLQRSTHAHIQLQQWAYLYAYPRCVCIVDPIPCNEILRAPFIGMSWLKYAATWWHSD